MLDAFHTVTLPVGAENYVKNRTETSCGLSCLILIWAELLQRNGFVRVFLLRALFFAKQFVFIEAEKGEIIADAFRKYTNCTVNQIGSLLSAFFTTENVRDYKSAKTSDTAEYGKYFNVMLDNGIYLAPAQFEAMFVSNAHSKEDLEKTIEVIKKFGSNF